MSGRMALVIFTVGEVNGGNRDISGTLSAANLFTNPFQPLYQTARQPGQLRVTFLRAQAIQSELPGRKVAGGWVLQRGHG